MRRPHANRVSVIGRRNTQTSKRRWSRCWPGGNSPGVQPRARQARHRISALFVRRGGAANFGICGGDFNPMPMCLWCCFCNSSVFGLAADLHDRVCTCQGLSTTNCILFSDLAFGDRSLPQG